MDDLELLSSATFPSSNPAVKNGVSAHVSLSHDDGSLNFFVNFDSPGIIRSRPLFIAAVEAAAYAAWGDAYMRLFGEEGALYANDDLMRVWANMEEMRK